MTRPNPRREAAPDALTGRLCEPVPKRPPLKPARVGLKSTAPDHRQVNEKDIKTPAPPLSADCGPSLYKGVPHAVGFIPMPGRGGARNRADRVSEAISVTAARGIVEAVTHAVQTGVPFNRWVTIHWDAARVADDLKAKERFLKLAGDWVRSQGGATAYVWVRENGPDKGRHVHILMHLPPDLADPFNRCQRGWLQACGASWRKGVILSRPIGLSLCHALSGGADYERNLTKTLGYALKGASQQAREALGIIECEPGGLVVGKRCGVSVNIGPAARAG